ncbi:MAG: phosphoglucomutase, partial [Gemmatimonadota bacterium]|nr:phosphoglucomutase [Gemmatimonadota bacterium]
MHPLAGHPAPADLLIDVAALERAYHERRPDPAVPVERVSFGTSGHRGTPGNGSFTAAHIRAITQAICEYRAGAGITGPLFVGKDTHALSRAAERTALEVLEAAGVDVVVQPGDGYTPTPVVSHAILEWNGNRGGAGLRGAELRSAPGMADGIVITPSHNPPEDGGFKYNPPNGGPADTDVTTWIQDRANQLLIGAVRATPRGRPSAARSEDMTAQYVDDLAAAIDFDAIRGARLRIGVDPMGGASLAAWAAIRDRYGLDLTIVNDRVDPRFGFMTVDHDGRIRMDCSSPAAMASLVGLKDRFDIACGNDPDADRHGIVTPSVGLMNPNHYLAVAIHYLRGHRPGWPAGAAVGKTLVSSAI